MPASTVVVVHDQAAAREALSAALTRAGFAVDSFSAAADCLADCDFRTVACAVVHHDMEDMTGFDLAKAFQTGWLGIPTILLARGFTGDQRARTDAGVIAVLGIPPQEQQLCDLVRQVVMAEPFRTSGAA